MAVASGHGLGSQPDACFESRCQNLVKALQAVADRMCVMELLPEGSHIVPFGSYVQGTCLLGAALDIALVYTGAKVDREDVEIIDTFVEFLIRHHGNSFRRSASTSANSSVRLTAGDFRFTPHIPMQEIALYTGDATTGVLDKFIKGALGSRPGATQFVMMVKNWAVQCQLVNQNTGSSFPWMLLALSCLQQKGMLPGFRDIVDGRLIQSQDVPSVDPLYMFRCFPNLVLDHLSKAGPHQLISLWTAAFVQPGGGVTAQSARTPLPNVDDILLPEDDFFGTIGSYMHQKLQQLSLELGANEHLISYSGSWPGVPIVSTATQIHEMPLTLMTPPQNRRAISPFGSSYDDDHHKCGPDHTTYGTIESFPSDSFQSPEKRSPPLSLPTPPGLSLPAPPGLSIPTKVDLKHCQYKTWTINAQWTATCTVRGRIVEIIQLDPSTSLDLSPKSWERRFNRREHQIRLAKATHEYALWGQLKELRGQQIGDPETPHVAGQNSKRYFETLFKEWRVAIHAAAQQLKTEKAGQRLLPSTHHETTGGHVTIVQI